MELSAEVIVYNDIDVAYTDRRTGEFVALKLSNEDANELRREGVAINRDDRVVYFVNF
jgi:hypothetical protein